MNNLICILKGGPGSGDFGHTGRPGKRGGSGGKGKLKKSKIQWPTETGDFFDPDAGIPIPSRKRDRTKRAPKKMKGKPRRASVNTNLSSNNVTDDTVNRSKDSNIDKLTGNFKAHSANVNNPNEDAVNAIISKTGVDKLTVEKYITDWNGDDIGKKYAISQSVRRTLGISMSSYEQFNDDRWSDDSSFQSPKRRSKYDKITKAIYDETQVQLKKLGSSEILLYRGLDMIDPDTASGTVTKWHGNTIDSWTTDSSTAKDFGDVILKSSIPTNRIFSMSSSGVGTSLEREMLVLGNGPNDEVLILRNE